jgi:hypothetical protein
MACPLLRLPVELLIIAVAKLSNDFQTMLSLSHSCRELRIIVQDVISTMRHVETLSQADKSALSLLELLYGPVLLPNNTTLPLPPGSVAHQDAATARAIRRAARVTSFKIFRQTPNPYSGLPAPLAAVPLPLARSSKYRPLIDNSGESASARSAWRNSVTRNDDNALLRVLLILLSSLEDLEIQGDLGCLPTKGYVTRTRALRSLRKLRLTAITNHDGLTTIVYHIIRSVNVTELDISDMHLSSAKIRELQPTDLASVTALRL